MTHKLFSTFLKRQKLLGISRRFSTAVKKEPVITKAPSPPHKNVSIGTLRTKKRKGQKISMVTACDFPSAVHVDKAGIDVLLVGDSLGMVELGYDTTLPVTMDMMIHHCQAVTRGCHRPLIIGDLPFGSFESCKQEAIRNSTRLMKEGGIDGIKIEGGKARKGTIQAIVEAGIAVMGHIGLTPQSYSALGGFKSQGKNADQALKLVEDALALQEAGVFSMVIECVPAVVAKEISNLLKIPTIGIGSGKYTDGQVLVYHDMLGMMQHYHHAEFTPRFCKQYATVGYEIQNGLAEYKKEVDSGVFPNDTYSPYEISEEQHKKFLANLEPFKTKQTSKETETVNDEENIKLY